MAWRLAAAALLLLALGSPHGASGARRGAHDTDSEREGAAEEEDDLRAEIEENACDRRLRDVLWGLSTSSLTAMSKKFVPEIQDHGRGPLTLVNRLIRYWRLFSKISVRAAANLDDADLVGELCHALAVRLRGFPRVDVLEQKSGAQLLSILQYMGLPDIGSRRRLISKIVSSAARVPWRMRRLLEIAPEASWGNMAARPGRMEECPAHVEIELHKRRHGVGGWAHEDLSAPATWAHTAYDAMSMHLERAFADLSLEAVSAIWLRFFGDDPRRTPMLRADLVRRIVARLTEIVPPASVGEMQRLQGAELFEEVCHKLSARELQACWGKALRQMTVPELRPLLSQIGLKALPPHERKNKVVRAILDAVESPWAARKLVHAVPTFAMLAPHNPRLGACPQVVRAEVAKTEPAKEPDAEGAEAPPLEEHLRDELGKLAPKALSALAGMFLTRKAQRAAKEPSLLVDKLVALVVETVPFPADRDAARLAGTELVGEVCHWLAVHARRRPCLDMLRRKSAAELLGVIRRLNLEVPESKRVDNLATTILREATTDEALRRKLLLATPELWDLAHLLSPTGVGRLDECPDVAKLMHEPRKPRTTSEEDELRSVASAALVVLAKRPRHTWSSSSEDGSSAASSSSSSTWAKSE